MPVISTFAALSAKGYGVGAGSPVFGGGGWIGYETTGTIFDNLVDSAGNTYYLINISNTATALVKTNYQGTVTFYKSIPAYLVTIQVDSSGNIYLGGIQQGGLTQSGFAYIMKLTSGGALTWARTLNGLGTGFRIHKIDIDASSNVICYTSNGGNSGGYIQINSSGTGTSQVLYTVSGVTTTGAINGYRNSAGSIWVTYGSILLATAPNQQGATGITCRNSAGTTIFNYEPSIGIADFVVDSNNNTYTAGITVNTTTKISTLVITKLNSSGVVQWAVAKSYAYAGAFITTIGYPKLTLNSTETTVYVSYTFSYTTTNASFVDALNTSTGAQIFSNYLRINGNFSSISGLTFSNYNNQILLSTTNDIFNLPSVIKVPAPGSYTNGTRSYIYYPTFDAGYSSVSDSTTSRTASFTSTTLTTTTITPTITDITNALSVISIGTGV